MDPWIIITAIATVILAVCSMIGGVTFVSTKLSSLDTKVTSNFALLNEKMTLMSSGFESRLQRLEKHQDTIQKDQHEQIEVLRNRLHDAMGKLQEQQLQVINRLMEQRGLGDQS